MGLNKLPRLFTWRTAITESDLPPTTKWVLVALSLYMNEKGESAFPSTKQLSRDTGYSERTVCTHLDKAKQLGWLSVSEHGYGDQRWRRHEYTPLTPDQGTERGSAAVDQGTEPHSGGTEPVSSKALKEVQSKSSDVEVHQGSHQTSTSSGSAAQPTSTDTSRQHADRDQTSSSMTFVGLDGNTYLFDHPDDGRIRLSADDVCREPRNRVKGLLTILVRDRGNGDEFERFLSAHGKNLFGFCEKLLKACERDQASFGKACELAMWALAASRVFETKPVPKAGDTPNLYAYLNKVGIFHAPKDRDEASWVVQARREMRERMSRSAEDDEQMIADLGASLIEDD